MTSWEKKSFPPTCEDISSRRRPSVSRWVGARCAAFLGGRPKLFVIETNVTDRFRGGTSSVSTLMAGWKASLSIVVFWRLGDDAPGKEGTDFNRGDRLVRATVSLPVGILGHVARWGKVFRAKWSFEVGLKNMACKNRDAECFDFLIHSHSYSVGGLSTANPLLKSIYSKNRHIYNLHLTTIDTTTKHQVLCILLA